MAKRDLSGVTYEYLFEKIVSNALSPGEALVENDICNMLHVSRTPVREALRKLETEGLVYKIPDRGTFVREITYEDIMEIMEIRILFEVHALQNCINNVPDQDLQLLEERLMALEPDSASNEYYHVDRDIHFMIMRYCPNMRIQSYLKTLNAQLERLRRVSALMPKRLSKSREEHLVIVRAIRNTDYETAKATLTIHLENVRSSVIEAYQMMKVI
jgi:DNA-binding GntR family transcriptional regulator